MIVFHELAFDGYVAQGPNPTFPSPYAVQGLSYSDPRLSELMGSVDRLSISGYVTQASGSSPTLSVWVQHANDRFVWYEQSAFPAVFALSLPANQETLFAKPDVAPGTNPKYAFARLAVQLSGAGTDSRAYVRIWVTGRDYSRRSMPRGAAQAQQPMMQQAMAQANGARPPRS